MEVRLSGKQNILKRSPRNTSDIFARRAAGGGETAQCAGACMQLGINPNTVERAYARFGGARLIYTLPKKGAFVSGQKAEAAIVEEARRHVKALRDAGLKKEELAAVAEEVYGEGETHD